MGQLGRKIGFLPLPLRSLVKRQGLFYHLITKNRVMNNYELMVIFTPVLSDDEFKAAQRKYTALVTDNGGSIVAENPWGLKSLAYPIQKKTTGLYWVMEFIAPSDFNEKLKIQLLRDESVLRHMATKLDKYAVEYNNKKRSGIPTGTEKVQEA
jgi:small subunit ribosomal protein S6